MILIADSGSTKTDWRLIDENKQIHQFTTQGINPYFQTSAQIVDLLKSELFSNIQHPTSVSCQESFGKTKRFTRRVKEKDIP